LKYCPADLAEVGALSTRTEADANAAFRGAHSHINYDLGDMIREFESPSLRSFQQDGLGLVLNATTGYLVLK
jgi:hypothetical protein